MIKIEVTGSTIPELADKLLAIGASLQNTITVYDTPARKTPPKKAEVMPEVAEAAPENPTSPSNIGATTVDGLSSQPTPKEPATTPAPAASASEDEELEVVDLPIAPPAEEIDLRALVLKVVVARGKPFMEDILSSFGVVKASHVEPARLHELVARCQEALGK